MFKEKIGNLESSKIKMLKNIIKLEILNIIKESINVKDYNIQKISNEKIKYGQTFSTFKDFIVQILSKNGIYFDDDEEENLEVEKVLSQTVSNIEPLLKFKISKSLGRGTQGIILLLENDLVLKIFKIRKMEDLEFVKNSKFFYKVGEVGIFDLYWVLMPKIIPLEDYYSDRKVDLKNDLDLLYELSIEYYDKNVEKSKILEYLNSLDLRLFNKQQGLEIVEEIVNSAKNSNMRVAKLDFHYSNIGYNQQDGKFEIFDV